MNDSLNEQYYIQEHHNFNISLGSSIEKIHPISPKINSKIISKD